MFALAYVAYFGIRALTEGHVAAAVANAGRVVHVERLLRIDWEAPVQELIVRRTAMLDAANAMYIWGHWPMLVAGGILLFRYRRHEYVRLRNAVLISGAIGLVVFALFPVAPPRLADLGLADTVTLHAPTYRAVLPASIVNEYAAMPSFHAGWNILLGITLWRSFRAPLVRCFALAMPGAMAFAVVATANHFVLDVAVGATIVLAAVVATDRIERRRSYI